MNEQPAAEPAKGSYVMIFVLIFGLVILAVAVSFAGLGPQAVYANLLIAGLQSCLLAYFFMHLKEADNLTWLICGAGIFWLILLFGLLLTDYLTRQIAAY